MQSASERRARRHLLAELSGIMLAIVLLAGALALLVKGNCENGDRACRAARVIDAIMSNIHELFVPGGHTGRPVLVPEPAIPAAGPVNDGDGAERQMALTSA